MNKFQSAASQTRCAFWIQTATPDAFALVALAPGAIESVMTREDFVGLITFCGLLPSVVLAVEIDDVSEQALSQAVIALVEQAMIRVESAGRYQRHAWSDLT
jgi:hypothetical protein